MRISTKGRYGLRAMLYLARQDNKKLISLKDIAKSEDISLRYLENIMRELVINGLVKSKRGKNGGFALSKNPKNITLAHILLALEGDLSLVACVEDPEVCERQCSCPTREVWCQFSEIIHNYFDSITLLSLIDKNEKVRGE